MKTVPEIEGKPAAWVEVKVEDKINIGNFQNVTFSATVGHYVEDSEEVIATEFKSLSSTCETFLADQRQEVLSSME